MKQIIKVLFATSLINLSSCDLKEIEPAQYPIQNAESSMPNQSLQELKAWKNRNKTQAIPWQDPILTIKPTKNKEKTFPSFK